MSTIYHLTPAAFFGNIPPDEDYLPAEFEADGFIHCTAGEDQMLEVANRYYKDEPGDFVLLVINEEAVHAVVRHEDPTREPDGNLYPHIYGPLNRDAITEVRPTQRKPDGTFHW